MANRANRPNDEENWQRALRNLEAQMAQYEKARADGDEALQGQLAIRIVEAMRNLSNIHPRPEMRNYWRGRADAFEVGDNTERGHILVDVGKGLLILLATPFALAGAAIFAAGAIVYGAGTLVKGLGNALTGGIFGRRRRSK
jgi:hypothetical protein